MQLVRMEDNSPLNIGDKLREIATGYSVIIKGWDAPDKETFGEEAEGQVWVYVEETGRDFFLNPSSFHVKFV